MHPKPSHLRNHFLVVVFFVFFVVISLCFLVFFVPWCESILCGLNGCTLATAVQAIHSYSCAFSGGTVNCSGLERG